MSVSLSILYEKVLFLVNQITVSAKIVTKNIRRRFEGYLARDNISEPEELRINDRLEDLVGTGRRCGWGGTGAGRRTEN